MERQSFSIESPLFLCQRFAGSICVHPYLDSLLYSVDLFVWSFANTTLFLINVALYKVLKLGSLSPLPFFFFFNFVFAILGLLLSTQTSEQVCQYAQSNLL